MKINRFLWLLLLAVSSFAHDLLSSLYFVAIEFVPRPKQTLAVFCIWLTCLSAFAQTHTEMTLEDPQNATGAKTFKNISGIVYAQGACVGDGVTNDTACLQNILNGMSAFQVLELGGKSFAITGTLSIPISNITVQNGKLLKVAAANDGHLLAGTSVNSIVVQNVTFDATNGVTHNGNTNDAVAVINGNGWKIVNNLFLGSYSGGVSVVGGSENEIAHNRFINSYTNAVQVCMNAAGSIATDHNQIHDNVIDGTTTQDGIFTTASCGSIATANTINRNQINNNTVLNTADSPIEAGINSQSTAVVGNTIFLNSASSHGAIISRDSLSVNIQDNTIFMSTASVTDGIALVNQIGATSQNYQTLVTGNNIVGRITRGCIYVQASRVKISNNQCQDTFITPNASGSNLEGEGVILATDSTMFDVTISDNKFYFLHFGVDANFGAGAVSMNGLTVKNNVLHSVFYGISLFNLTITNSYIENNDITNVNTAAFNNVATVAGATDWILFNNVVLTCTGTGCFTGAAPTLTSTTWSAALNLIQLSTAGAFQFGSAGQFQINTSGLPTNSNNLTLAGQGFPAILGVTSQKAETTTADANVLTVTPAAAAGTYRACVAVSVSAATAGVIGWTLSYTDSNGTAQSNIAQSLFQNGAAAPALTFTTSAAGNYQSCSVIDVNSAAANIIVKWVGGGTTTAKMSATIERII